MNILILGRGAREYALCRAVSSPSSRIYSFPSNSGIDYNFSTSKVPLEIEDVIASRGKSLSDWIKQSSIDMVIVGDESFLFMGIADQLADKKNIALCAPNALASKLESSKIYAKELMTELAIDTPSYMIVDNKEMIGEVKKNRFSRYVLKFEGPAMGKGVMLDTATKDVADKFFTRYLDGNNRGLLMEERITGREISLFFLIDRHTVLPLIGVKDYKQRVRGGKEANTGGMGALAPYNNEYLVYAKEKIVEPIISCLKQKDICYRGILYIGGMLTQKGLSVLEFNVRLGDPEAQSLLKLMCVDFKKLVSAVSRDELHRYTDIPLFKKDAVAVTCNVVYRHYPQKSSPKLKFDIQRLKSLEKKHGVYVDFYCLGYEQTNGGGERDAYLMGGRLFSVTAVSPSISASREKVYAFISDLHLDREVFDFRDDIGEFRV